MAKSHIAGINAQFRSFETKLPEDVRMLNDEWAKYLTLLTPQARFLKIAMRFSPKLHKLADQLLTAHCLRHRSIDELIMLALQKGYRRVVVMGAGYDMRPSRFATSLTGIEWIELDREEMIAGKVKVLKKLNIEAFDPQRIGFDFRSERLSRFKGEWDQAVPTAFVMEGLVHYLSVPIVENILKDVFELSDKPALIFSYMETEMYKSGTSIVGGLVQKLGEIPVLHFKREVLRELLLKNGFTKSEFYPAARQIAEFCPQAASRPLSVSQEVVWTEC